MIIWFLSEKCVEFDQHICRKISIICYIDCFQFAKIYEQTEAMKLIGEDALYRLLKMTYEF